eukprot:COSAG01_NODE_22901_length_836_cov_1.666214_1_plen_189_part_00
MLAPQAGCIHGMRRTPHTVVGGGRRTHCLHQQYGAWCRAGPPRAAASPRCRPPGTRRPQQCAPGSLQFTYMSGRQRYRGASEEAAAAAAAADDGDAAEARPARARPCAWALQLALHGCWMIGSEQHPPMAAYSTAVRTVRVQTPVLLQDPALLDLHVRLGGCSACWMSGRVVLDQWGWPVWIFRTHPH